MVNERAPPKVPPSLDGTAGASSAKKPADDDDDDYDIISAMKGLSSLKASVRDGFLDPTPSSSAAAAASGSSSQNHGQPLPGHPKLGGHHHAGMMSSRKQKANIFNQRTSRPEHHLGQVNKKVTGPMAPKYHDKKAPSLPVFDSNIGAAALPPAPGGYSDEVFYTDPTKASEDLKNLLEGNMDDEEDGDVPADSQKTEGESSQDVTDLKSGAIEGLAVRLLPHQVEGVEWMRGRELGPVKRGKVPKGGILADDMGLGKTLQSISLILTNQKPAKEDKAWKKHYEGLEKTTLVVAPLSLIRQWESEIIEKITKKHQLKVCVHHGPNRTKRFKDLALYDVVVTTYQVLVSEFGHSSMADEGVKAGCFGLNWWRVILDEAHSIKNRNAKATKAACALNCEYRWCLSGTPMQNNLDELQSLIKFLRIKPYDDLKAWKQHIDLPMKNGKGHIAIRRLHSVLRCFMKRRTKEILKEEGALNPGGKKAEGEEGVPSPGFKVTQRNVIMVSAELSNAERKFYDRLQARADKSLEVMMGGKVNYASALTLLLRMRQACDHPQLVAGKLSKDLDALSTGSGQKPQGIDVDTMADMFSTMGIESKSCNICGNKLGGEEVRLAKEMCSECSADLQYFDNHGQSKKKSKKSKKKKTKESAKSTAKKVGRRPRNRNAVIDSDDEEDGEEGSWLVPEDQRGATNLGRAGGEEDENAEGGGDSIGPEDSEDSEDEDQSNLSSFVVDDEAPKDAKKKAVVDDDDDDDDDSLPSIAALTSKMASQTLEDKPKPVEALSESETETEDDDYSDSEDNKRLAVPNMHTSAKIRELIKILDREVAEHKFIVFSQFTSMLDLVEPFLYNSGFGFTRYDGSMRNDEREESLRRLRKDSDTRILLCSLKCGSLGLNLTAATRVVILEPFWNPFVEEQAIDRVHRLTQTIDVNVYRLTVANSIEERIVALQDKKRELAEQAIEGGMKKGAFKLGINEIIDLFKPGHHEQQQHQQQSTGGEGSDTTARPGVLRRNPSVQRQESQVYGRRW